MKFNMKIDNLGCVDRGELLWTILPKYSVDLKGLGIKDPFSIGKVQQYKWSFEINRPLEDVAAYFNEERAIGILREAGKPSLKQFEMKAGSRVEPGARGLYWIKKPITVGKGEFMITHAGMYDGAYRVGYIRIEDFGINWSFVGMLDKSGFGFSIFEFTKIDEGKTLGSYYLAQQLPGHLWGQPMVPLLKKKLNNPAFYTTFMKLKETIENS